MMYIAIKIRDKSVEFKRDGFIPRVGDSIGDAAEPGKKLPIVTNVILWPNSKILSFHGVHTDYDISALVMTD